MVQLIDAKDNGPNNFYLHAPRYCNHLVSIKIIKMRTIITSVIFQLIFLTKPRMKPFRPLRRPKRCHMAPLGKADRL
jgi:hypothetical protein